MRPNSPCLLHPAAAALLLLAACDSAPVEPPVTVPTWLFVSSDTVELTYFGERARIAVTVRPEPPAGSEVKWSSTDTSVVTVDADGRVTARANGLAGVVAELADLRDTAVVLVRQEASRLEVMGGGQRAGAGQALVERVGVRVLDEGGHVVVRYNPRVFFDASADGGKVNPPEANAWDGSAWTTWTLGPVPGPQALAVETLRVSGEIRAMGLEPDSVAAAVAVHEGEGQGALPGEALDEPVVVAVVDVLGHRVPGATVRFEPVAGHGSVDPAETESDSAGLATTAWTLGSAPGTQLLIASSVKGLGAEISAMALIDEGVCSRTLAVAEEIVRLAGVAGCADVTDAHLAGILSLDVHNRGIRRLRSGDFSGLRNLVQLYLNDNQLLTLPPDIFAGLSALRVLHLQRNLLAALRPGVFDDLPSLRSLWLRENELVGLPPDIFAGLTQLRYVLLGANNIESLPTGIFDGLRQLDWLQLRSNNLESLPPGIFDALERLEGLELGGNHLESLPPGIFDALERLEILGLALNRLSELPPGTFDQLENLRELNLHYNDLAALGPGTFDVLRKLEYLDLSVNEIGALPPRLFAGMHRLVRFFGRSNPGSPFPVAVAFERTDAGDLLEPGPAQVVLRVPDGAPFGFRVPVSVQRGEASAAWLEVAVGDTVSGPLAVTRPTGSAEAVYVSFGQPPGLPPRYDGLDMVLDGQMVLFATSDNRTPVFREAVPAYWLQAGGAAQPLPLGPYFSDPDGDSLLYRAETSDARVVDGRIEGAVLWIEPGAEGEAVIEVTAADPGGLAASQRLAVQVAPAPDPDRFNIDLIFEPGFTDEQKAAVRRAADRWEEVVVGDLPDIPIDGYMDANVKRNLRLAGVVDDLVVHSKWGLSSLTTFAWRAGEREESGLAFYGGASYAAAADTWRLDLFESVAKHEIGHVLGIGGGQPWLSRKRGPQGEYYFAGPLAIQAFNAAGGLAYGRPKIPLNSTAVHWRGLVIRGELMSQSPYRGVTLSAITLEALADMGHVVDLTKADPYTLPGAASTLGAPTADAADADTLRFADDILRVPVVVVDSTGKVVRVIRN